MRLETLLNFTQLLRSMAQVRRMGVLSTKEKENLLRQLEQKQKIISRSWLLEKIGQG